MDKIVVNGGRKLYGSLNICGAKNSFLPILAGCILCDGIVKLKNVPKFKDIINMCYILESIGAKIKKQNNDLIINCSDINNWELPYDLTKLLRSSIFCLGALLARFKKAKVTFPGGCAIGARPIDLHISGLKRLGIKIQEQDDFLICETTKVIGNDIHLNFPSVGATENLMLASCRADGITHIYNCAKEPEIVDLQNFLNELGFKICGAGTETITIVGTKSKTKSIEYTPIADRMIAGTHIITVAMTGGEVELINANQNHLKILLKKIQNNCCKTFCFSDKIVVQADGNPKSFGKIETAPYPQFPTDLQSQMVALASVCKGTSVIVENVFENRFKHVAELVKMGADITLKDNQIVVKGKNLIGNNVYATDLRSGACLISAGLVANGTTVINDVFHIDRGYDNIEKDYSLLGADIKRIKFEEKNNNLVKY